MAGNSAFYPEAANHHNKAFQEVLGKPMIQRVVENLMTIKAEKKFVFIVNDSDVKKYRLDNVLKILTKNNCEIIAQNKPTKGAVCSILLAAKFINHDGPILISNADQIIDHDLNSVTDFFLQKEIDGGVVCFDSLHPQWSYARIEDENKLIETAEKQLISNNAIAGLYYFSRGKDFLASAMASIFKDRNLNGLFYTSMVLNEMVLENKNLRTYRIKPNEYHSFYSPKKIQEFEGARHA